MGSHCLDCIKANRPPAAERVRRQMAFGPPYVTYTLIGLSVLAYLRFPGTGGAGNDIIDFTLIAGPIAVLDEWYRIVTSAFLHVNPIHLLFNMAVLFQLGTILERAFMWWRYLGVYVLGLLGGSLGALALDPNAHTLGASGAVYGLMGALFVLSQRRGLDPWRSVGWLIGINLLITLTLPNISLGGHVGGLIAGGLAGWALDPARSGWRSQPAVAAAIVGVGAVALFASSILVAELNF